jgi:hypothetical protein
MMTRTIAALGNCRSPVTELRRATFAEPVGGFADPTLSTSDGPVRMPAEIKPRPHTSQRVRSADSLVLDVAAVTGTVVGGGERRRLGEVGDIAPSMQWWRLANFQSHFTWCRAEELLVGRSAPFMTGWLSERQVRSKSPNVANKR